LDSRVPDDPYLGRELARYFPKPLLANFPDAVARHRLRREIIATQLANSIINRGGPTLIARITDQTGAAPAAIAAALPATRESYGPSDLNAAIDALDGRVRGALQLELYAAVQDLLIDRLIWFLRNVELARGLADIVEHYRAGISSVEAVLANVLTREAQIAQAARASELVAGGVGGRPAPGIPRLPALAAATGIVLVAGPAGKPIDEIAATFFAAGAYFQLDRIAHAARGIKLTDYFDQLALDRALDSIAEAERRLTAEMVGNGIAGPAAVEQWIAAHAG